MAFFSTVVMESKGLQGREKVSELHWGREGGRRKREVRRRERERGQTRCHTHHDTGQSKKSPAWEWVALTPGSFSSAEKRAWHTLSAHASKPPEILGVRISP